MLILSQDRTKIINFANMNTICANSNGCILSFDNTWRAGDDCSDVLGVYDTEERAKEILKEIIEKYKEENYAMIESMAKAQLVYEMPEK